MTSRHFLAVTNPIKDTMFRLALRLLQSKEAAEDAVQETLVKLWKKKEKLSSYNNPQAFAMTVIKNHCLDQLKLKANNNLRIVHQNYEDHKASLQQELEAKDELMLVAEIIKKLSVQEQLLIQLRDIEQLDYREIASIAEMNETAIRVALSRARKKIRNELQKKHRYGIA